MRNLNESKKIISLKCEGNNISSSRNIDPYHNYNKQIITNLDELRSYQKKRLSVKEKHKLNRSLM